MEDFTDKTVLVTGAGGGLGYATALAFAKAGASVSLADMDGDALAKTAAAILALEDASEPMVNVVDLGSRQACFDLVDATAGHFGSLDVLCNVAGLLGICRVENITEAMWNTILAVNLSAPFWLSQAAIPHLLKSEGNIVNVASTGAFIGESYLAPYTATKAALVHLTKSMAMEFLKAPIRINAIAPGAMLTNMAKPDAFPTDLDMELVQHFMPKRPPAEPDLVADSILYLASARASNIHGTCLVSDGGHIAG